MKWWKVKFVSGKQFSILASSAYEAMTFAQTLAEEDGEGDLRVLSVEDEEVIMTGPIVVGDVPEVEYTIEVAEWKPNN